MGEEKRKRTRREFLRISALATAGVALAACKQPTPTTDTTTDPVATDPSSPPPPPPPATSLQGENMEKDEGIVNTIEKFVDYRAQAINLLAGEFPEMVERFSDVKVRVRFSNRDSVDAKYNENQDTTKVIMAGVTIGSETVYDYWDIGDGKFNHTDGVIDILIDSPLIADAEVYGVTRDKLYIYIIAREMLNTFDKGSTISDTMRAGLVDAATYYAGKRREDTSSKELNGWDSLSEFYQQNKADTTGFSILFDEQNMTNVQEYYRHLISLRVLSTAIHSFIVQKLMRDVYDINEEALQSALNSSRKPVSKGMYCYLFYQLLEYEMEEKVLENIETWDCDSVYMIDLFEKRCKNGKNIYENVVDFVRVSEIATLFSNEKKSAVLAVLFETASIIQLNAYNQKYFDPK